MAVVSCPRCGTVNPREGFPVWVYLVAVFFFPFGLLAFLAGRKPTQCRNCGFVFAT